MDAGWRLDAVAGGLLRYTGGDGIDQGWAERAAEGEVKVGEHDVAILTNKDVLRLEITIDDAKHVEVFQG